MFKSLFNFSRFSTDNTQMSQDQALDIGIRNNQFLQSIFNIIQLVTSYSLLLLSFIVKIKKIYLIYKQSLLSSSSPSSTTTSSSSNLSLIFSFSSSSNLVASLASILAKSQSIQAYYQQRVVQQQVQVVKVKQGQTLSRYIRQL